MIFVYWENIGREFFIYAIVIDWRMGSRACGRFEKLGRLYPSLLLCFFCIIYVSLVVIFIIADYVPWTWVDD